MKLKKLLFLIFLFTSSVYLTGCEKEVGDVVSADINNPYEGHYTFSVYGELSGSTNMVINNRGGFSFFITLRSSTGGAPYTVTVTGIVYENGAIDGSIFRSQADYGYLNGQLGSGQFIVQEETGTLNCTYGAALIQ